MTGNTISISRGAAIASALGLVILGAAGTFGWIRVRGDVSPRPKTEAAGVPGHDAPAAPSSTPAGTPQDVVLRLSPEAIARAGIEVAAVTAAAGDASIRVPGVVQANGYKQVVVSPLVGGRVTRVQAELGQRVRRGQLLASIYGPDAADAQAKLLAARAGLEAHDRELRRTEQLVGIGAASRQELERLHAEHAAKVAEVESARARLDVIGGTPGAEEGGPSRSTSPSNTVDVRAPIDGTVVERSANAGLNVEVGMPIFTIADLSSVWVVGELYEQDFARVRLGTKALVTIPGVARAGAGRCQLHRSPGVRRYADGQGAHGAAESRAAHAPRDVRRSAAQRRGTTGGWNWSDGAEERRADRRRPDGRLRESRGSGAVLGTRR